LTFTQEVEGQNTLKIDSPLHSATRFQSEDV